MGADLTGFDASKVEPASDFEPIPRGEYVGMMIDSEYKPTQKGDGQYLNCAFEVLDGDHKGRKLWDRLNMRNPSPAAVKIAESTLSSICRSVDVNQPRNSAELHNKPLIIKVDVEERNDKPGVWRNVIKGYSAIGGKPKQADLQATAAAKPPWKK